MAEVFTFPNRILFGEGARASLVEELARLGITRPLVVSDPGVEAAGIAHEITSAIKNASLFIGVSANPTENDVLAGVEQFRSEACDGLVGLGGGSAIDTAKAIRLLATHSGSLADYDFTQGGTARITANLPPMAALPTTAGTGSESARGALIQLPQTGRKTIVLSPFLLPSVAICDPDLTLGMNPQLTAATGMDAYTHCVESYLSNTFHPICDGIALEGLRHIFRGLESAVGDGSNRPARTEMMLGALMGGISFHKGLGAVHSLSHALGATGRVHHGTLNAILLPHVLRFNRKAAETRLADMAAQVGLGRSGDGASHFIALAELVLARLPLPTRLGQLEGLDRAQIPHYAALAIVDHCHRTNPRPCSQADMQSLLEAAW
jgi:alcohol dehydrogenase class IV